MLALLDVAVPMGAIQTEVPPAIQMEQLKQRRDQVTVFGRTVWFKIVKVVLDHVVMQRMVTVAVAVVEQVTMEVERDGMV